MNPLSSVQSYIVSQRAAAIRAEVQSCATRVELINAVGGHADWWAARASRLTAALGRLEQAATR